MIRSAARSMLVLALSTAFLSTGAVSAQAWANGGRDPNNPDPDNRDRYGTHDWIIDQALKVVDGRANSWFDAQTARLASDDPDTTRTELDPALGSDHVYRDVGRRGGAVHRIAELYSDALAQHRAGKAAAASGDTATAKAQFLAASKTIGLLAHYYGDLAMPYHTAYAGIDAPGHIEYELLVDGLTKSASDQPTWSSPKRTVEAISDIRTEVIASAAYSRAYFPALYEAFSPNMTVLNSRVREITGYVMRRVANDLANAIYSIGRGVGEAPHVASLSASIHLRYVRQYEDYQAVYVTAKDANGRPIEGVAVDVAWPMPDGTTKRFRMFTDGYGKQRSGGPYVGNSPLMVRRDVKTWATTNERTTTAYTWYMATPVLASGTDGFKTTVNDSTLVAGQNVTVTSTTRDTAGRPVKGLFVTWTWDYGDRIVKTSGYTDSYGKARSTRTITSTTTYNTVYVRAHVQSGSLNRYSRTSFRRV